MSEQSPKSLAEKLQVFIDIARLRRGPEDLPFDRTLLPVTVVAFGLLNLGVGLLLSDQVVSPLPVVLIHIVVTLACLRWLLRLANKPERFAQTAAAMFGFQLVLMPVRLLTTWLWLRYGKDPVWQIPVVLLELAVTIWALAAAGRILRSATAWPMFACVAMIISVEFFTLLIIALVFPQALPASAQS